MAASVSIAGRSAGAASKARLPGGMARRAGQSATSSGARPVAAASRGRAADAPGDGEAAASAEADPRHRRGRPPGGRLPRRSGAGRGSGRRVAAGSPSFARPMRPSRHRHRGRAPRAAEGRLALARRAQRQAGAEGLRHLRPAAFQAASAASSRTILASGSNARGATSGTFQAGSACSSPGGRTSSSGSSSGSSSSEAGPSITVSVSARLRWLSRSMRWIASIRPASSRNRQARPPAGTHPPPRHGSPPRRARPPTRRTRSQAGAAPAAAPRIERRTLLEPQRGGGVRTRQALRGGLHRGDQQARSPAAAISAGSAIRRPITAREGETLS